MFNYPANVCLLCPNRKQPLLWVQGDIFRSAQRSKTVNEDGMSKVVSGLDDISISGNLNKVENLERYVEVTLHDTIPT